MSSMYNYVHAAKIFKATSKTCYKKAFIRIILAPTICSLIGEVMITSINGDFIREVMVTSINATICSLILVTLILVNFF